MPLKDQIKNYAMKFIEDRPDPTMLKIMVRVRKPLAVLFSDDGVVPNNPHFPLLIYRGAVAVETKKFDAATVVDTLFETNGWGRSWRDTIYDFVHYHSQVHEVLGVAGGTAKVEFGGVKGRILTVKPGDVVVLPAGTGHRLIDASRDFWWWAPIRRTAPTTNAPIRATAPTRSSALPRCASRAETPSMGRPAR